MSNMGYSLFSFEMSEGEARSLSHDTILVLQKTNQFIHNIITVVSSPAQGNGSHGTNIGVLVFEQLDQGINHSRVLELSCVCVV